MFRMPLSEFQITADLLFTGLNTPTYLSDMHFHPWTPWTSLSPSSSPDSAVLNEIASQFSQESRK